MICEIPKIENLNTKVNIYGLETLYGILFYSLLINVSSNLLSDLFSFQNQNKKKL